MMRSKIVVFCTKEDEHVGLEIKVILEGADDFSVDLLYGRLSADRLTRDGFLPQVLMAVVPSARHEVPAFHRELCVLDARCRLLTVLHPGLVNEELEGLEKSQDFLVLPLKETEILFRVRRLVATGHSDLALSQATEVCGLSQLIGEDPEFVNLKRRISIVARFDSTVLLTGETGTGKERVARALHYASPRAAKPFLPVNCGAIPLDLFESELYGHRRGAFTGAVTAEAGLIAEAEGGTLFLDEVETLTMGSQVKLLRFLQDRVYYPVGSAKPKRANVWIVASTNIELPLRIQDGTFREDLYYRLAVISLTLPPLRRRKADIPLLAAHFWKMYSARAGRSERALSSQVMDALRRHSWPGNVRELQNVVQQLAVLGESETIQPEHLPIPIGDVNRDATCRSFAQKKALVIEEFEKQYVTELLRSHRGNVTRAAQEARKDRRALGRLIKKYQIDRHQSHD